MDTIKSQYLLTYLGYDTGGCDGIAGEKTRQAVREFQEDFGGLTVDGVAGAQTCKALKHAVAYDMFRKPRQTVQESVTDAQNAPSWWGDIEYFRRSEFACKCGQTHAPYCDGYPDEPKEKLVRLADAVREHFGRPVHITSGLRCPQHNSDVGGVENSRHLSGKAMDFKVDGHSAAQILAWVQGQKAVRYAYAVSDRVVHMDIE